VAHLVADHHLRDFFKGLGVGLLVNFVEELLDVPGDKIEPEAWRSLFMRPCYFGYGTAATLGCFIRLLINLCRLAF